MAVALDTVGTAGTTNGTPTTSVTGTGTVGSGTNRALVVQLGIDVKTVTGITVTWDPAGANQALTLISSQVETTYGMAQLYGLVNPTTGATKNVTASWTGNSDAGIQSVSYTGVDQTGGTTSFVAATPATGGGTGPSITITSAVGNATLECFYGEPSGGPSGPSQTQTFVDLTWAGGYGGGSRAVGAATVVHSWTSVYTHWASVGVNTVAAATVAQYVNVINTLNSGGRVGLNRLRL